MDYEIVTLEEKRIAGVKTQTSNQDPEMGAKIGGLWQRLYQGGVMEMIPGRIGERAYGIYCNYESDVNGAYDVMAGCEVKTLEGLDEKVAGITIPAGSYAKFSLVVNMQAGGVGELWSQIWQTALPRAYTVDFEEYLPVEDPKQARVNVYIALLG